MVVRLRRVQRWGKKRFNSLSLAHKLLLSLLLAVGITVGVLTLVYHEQILHGMLPLKTKLRYVCFRGRTRNKPGWLRLPEL